MARVELSKRAAQDLARLGNESATVERVLAALEREPRDPNLDIKPLRGRQPWHRLRAGSFRVIFRALTGVELVALAPRPSMGFLVVRVVRRRDLEKAIKALA